MLLSEIVETSAAVRGTRSRIRKRKALADALRAMSLDEVRVGVSYLSGELPQGRIGLGYAAVHRAEVAPARQPELTISATDAALTEIASMSGAGSQLRRKQALEQLLGAATLVEQDFLRALLLRELRQGALENSMAEAIAEVVGTDAPTVLRAVMLSGELTEVAMSALEHGTDGLKRFRLHLFRPVRPMLARSAASAAEALQRNAPASVEVKIDGARVQVHKKGERVAVYTRNLRDVTRFLPDVVEAARSIAADAAIVDGEVIALDSAGRPQPFQVTMSRFGRQLNLEQARRVTPLTAFYFDCLHADGADLIDETAEHRWQALSRIVPSGNLPRRITTASESDVQEFYRGALESGHEGIMVKALSATYSAGRRGAGWLKVKPAHTLDLVVLAVEWGSGRRRGWLSNLHLGARDELTGDFVMLGKTFKGLTDEMLAWQTERFLGLETGRAGHVVNVRPEQVVEIAFDGVQASTRYPGGMALRFARVKGHRNDKSPDEVDSIETVRRIFEGRQPDQDPEAR